MSLDTGSLNRSPNPQEEHYARIHDEYVAHYFDPSSIEFRRRFIFRRLLDGIDLTGKRVAELACSAGYNSLLVRELFPAVAIEGYDISESACSEYTRLVNAPAHLVDLTRPAGLTPSYDAAFIVGGLHHCANFLPQTFHNVAAMLKPGGVFFWYEPNADFGLQAVRDLWYRRDAYFDETSERALTVRELEEKAAPYFSREKQFYLGGPAYFLILNSLVLRLPLGAKRTIARMLFPLESLWDRLAISGMHPVIAGVWRRTDAEVAAERRPS